MVSPTVATPTLKRVEIHLADGRVRKFDREQIESAAVLPTGAIVVVKVPPDKFERYIGFPMIFVEEYSAVEVVSTIPAKGGLLG